MVERCICWGDSGKSASKAPAHETEKICFSALLILLEANAVAGETNAAEPASEVG